ncbi:MAG: fimbrillin family protein, partial [Alistipes sp.]
MSLMLAASALTSCANDDASAITPDAQGVAVNITAELPQTRTEIGYGEGAYTVAWKADDKIYVSAYTDAEKAAETKDGPWTWGKPYNTNAPRVYNYANGAFVAPADATIAPGTYNFTAIYTYAGQATYPDSNKFPAGQTQDCTNPMAHLATYDCLVGFSKVTIPDAQPSFTMKRIYSWMKIAVTNGTGTAATIKSVDFTSTETLADAKFNINFETGAVTPDYAGAKTISVAMDKATALAPTATQDAYFVFA